MLQNPQQKYLLSPDVLQFSGGAHEKNYFRGRRLALIETIAVGKKSVFIQGKAGTEKSTFITGIKSEVPGLIPRLEEMGISYIRCAPTHVAANHIGGMTIHKHFGLSPPKEKIETDSLENDYNFNPAFYKRQNHPSVYIIDESGMLDEILWGHLHEVRRMFPDIVFVCVFDQTQCPPVPP